MMRGADKMIFALNLGSTSTKIGVFKNRTLLFSSTIRHSPEQLGGFSDLLEQEIFRIDVVMHTMEEHGFDLAGFDAYTTLVGGISVPEAGAYQVTERMIDQALYKANVKHPVCLGCKIVDGFARRYGGIAMTGTPQSVDELDERARITGLRGIYRESNPHGLSQKEVAIAYARKHGAAYRDLNLVVAHLGGGISVVAHRKGRMVDTNDTQGDGPFCPTRSGNIPTRALIQLCYSGEYTEEQALELVNRRGGMLSLLGTNDMRTINAWILQGSHYASSVYEAMIYQIAKEIGSRAVALTGDVDAIILTGGMANDVGLADRLRQMCGWIAPVCVMTGDYELLGLGASAYRVLTGEEPLRQYTGEPVWTGLKDDRTK